MGLIHVTATLKATPTSRKKYQDEFLVDTGATDSLAPEKNLYSIGIKPVGKTVYELADGTVKELPFGTAIIEFMGDVTAGRVIFGPNNIEPILGVTALESVGILVDAKKQRLKRIPAIPLKPVLAAAHKKRLDLLLLEKGLAETRNKAQAMIMAGQVKIVNGKWKMVNGEKIQPYSLFTIHCSLPLKPGTLLPVDSEIEIKQLPRFVSRGGEKLQAALDHWKTSGSRGELIPPYHVSAQDKICLDIGSSTGGFTDCLLQNGAKKVYAVDVGTGQMHPKLRNDSRVELYEQTHILKWTPPWRCAEAQSSEFRVRSSELEIRNKKNSQLPTLNSQLPSLVTIDLSFISLRKVIPKILDLFSIHYSPLTILCLLKPQFEVGPRYIMKGIVRDQKIRQKAVKSFINFCESLPLKVIDHFPCPVLGAKGNQEEWLYLTSNS